jgi:hypothetical protein
MKLSFPNCYSFLLEHHIENMRVVMNSISSLLTISHVNVSLIPDRFTSTNGRSWCLRLIALE